MYWHGCILQKLTFARADLARTEEIAVRAWECMRAHASQATLDSTAKQVSTGYVMHIYNSFEVFLH